MASTDQSLGTRLDTPPLLRPVAATAEREGMGALIKLIVFLGGMTSIGIELAASRLIAPFFGDSTFIWANLIGLTLACLALGYYLGGRVADRYPYPRILFALT